MTSYWQPPLQSSITRIILTFLNLCPFPFLYLCQWEILLLLPQCILHLLVNICLFDKLSYMWQCLDPAGSLTGPVLLVVFSKSFLIPEFPILCFLWHSGLHLPLRPIPAPDLAAYEQRVSLGLSDMSCFIAVGSWEYPTSLPPSCWELPQLLELS